MTLDAPKPPARMESREPRCIRFKPSEWEELANAARAAGLEPSRFAREMCFIGLSVHQATALRQSHTRITA